MNITLNLAHLGLLDSAPLLLAQEHGMFREAGLEVHLRCELGYAGIISKLLEAQLHGACLPAELPVVLSLPPSKQRIPMEVAAIVAYQNLRIATRGNALPVAVEQPKVSLKLGLPLHLGGARLIADRWLASLGGTVAARTTIVPTTTSQLVPFLQEGLIDAFVGPEPWPTIAALGANVIHAAASPTSTVAYPGAVVALRAEVASTCPEAAPRLAQALRAACAYCTDPRNAPEVWQLLLRQPPYCGLGDSEREALPAVPFHGTALSPALRFAADPASLMLEPESWAYLESAARAAGGATSRSPNVWPTEVARVYRRSAQAVS